jgi:hypothetical protein
MNNGIKFLLAILFIIAAVKAYEFDQFEDMLAVNATTSGAGSIGVSLMLIVVSLICALF